MTQSDIATLRMPITLSYLEQIFLTPSPTVRTHHNLRYRIKHSTKAVDTYFGTVLQIDFTHHKRSLELSGYSSSAQLAPVHIKRRAQHARRRSEQATTRRK